MASAEDTGPAEATAKPGADTNEPSDPSSDPAWPPVEARPDEPSPAAGTDDSGKGAAPAALGEEAILTKPADTSPAAAKAAEAEQASWEEKSSEPKQEMGLSESTLHWLVDGEKPIEPHENEPGTGPVYDSRAPVAGRKRNVVVIGGAAVVALVVAAFLHFQAARHETAADAPMVEPASVLTQRAETALSAGRAGEAMEQANLAIVANPRFADAYFVVGNVQRASGRLPEARDAFRKYLELAPIGTHAGDARDALAALPP